MSSVFKVSLKWAGTVFYSDFAYVAKAESGGLRGQI